MKISHKLSLIVSILIVLSLGTVSTLGYFSIQNLAVDSFNKQAELELNSITSNIDSWVDGKELLFVSAAELDIAKKMKYDDVLKWSDAMEPIVPEAESLFALIDMKGNVHLPGGLLVPTIDYPHTQHGLKGEIGTFGPFASAQDGRPIALSVAPVKNDKGKQVGIINGGFYLEDLIKTLSKKEITENSETIVFGKDGTIVLHENEKLILNKKISDLKIDALNKVATETFKQKDGMGIIEETVKGEKSFIYFQKANNVDWGTLIIVPQADVFAAANETLTFVISGTVIAIVLAVVIITLVTRRSMRPLEFIHEKLDVLSSNSGDLTARLPVTSNDEFGQLSKKFNLMLDNFQGLFANILTKGNEVNQATSLLLSQFNDMSKASETITDSIQDVASLSEDQMESFNASIASIKEMNESITLISDSSSVSSDKSSYASQKATEGSEKINVLTKQMTLIESSVNDSASSINHLEQRSKEIDKILEIITNIANQTNLLALNASIEAARAGEHGRGFAVVADEVKKLADESQQSAKQISSIINEIQSVTKNIAESMNEEIKNVNIGIKQTSDLDKTFNEIVDSTKNAANQIENTFTSIENLVNHAQEVETISKNNIDKTVDVSGNYQTIASSSEEQFSSILSIQESVNELSKLSIELNKMFEDFKID